MCNLLVTILFDVIKSQCINDFFFFMGKYIMSINILASCHRFCFVFSVYPALSSSLATSRVTVQITGQRLNGETLTYTTELTNRSSAKFMEYDVAFCSIVCIFLFTSKC